MTEPGASTLRDTPETSTQLPPAAGTDPAAGELPPPAGGARRRRPARPRRYGSRAPAFVRRFPALHLTWRIGVLLVGVAVIAAGVAMWVLPGPGWLAILLGLAVLATEFVWAQRVLGWAHRQYERAKEKALDPAHRRRNRAIALVAAAVLVLSLATTGYLWWLGRLDPMITWLPGETLDGLRRAVVV